MEHICQKIRHLIAQHASVRFVIIGVTATVIHYGIYYVLLWLGVSYNMGYTLGYALSLVFNFYATGVFTFRTSINAAKGVRFLACHGINYLLHISLLNLFVWLGLSKIIAPLFVLSIAVPVNFVLVRYAMRDKKMKL